MITERVKDYIEERGIKKTAISKAIGISPQVLNYALSGKRKLTAEEYVGICDFLRVPYSEFIEK